MKNFKTIAAMLLLSASSQIVFTACQDNAEEEIVTFKNPMSTNLQGMWVSEKAESGELPALVKGDPKRTYTKVVNAYKFFGDGTGVWEKFYVNDKGEVTSALGDIIYGEPDKASADGFFRCTSAADGTIGVTMAHPELFNQENHVSINRKLNYANGQINTSDGSETYQLTRASEQQQMEIMNYANNAHCGGVFNPNGAEGANGFNYSSWRNRETIILYTGELGDKAGELTGYKEVALPWAKIDKQINIPQNIIDDLKPENGWEMVLSRCGYSLMNNSNFIFLYNKYTGIMRILYYMPQKFESGSDHLWEIQVSDHMALRSPWGYGVPSDTQFKDKAAIGQKTAGHMTNNVSSWYDGYKINESITSREGWWAFDYDMSLYRPGHDIKKDEIKLAMHSWNKTGIKIDSNIDAKIKTEMEQTSLSHDLVNGVKTVISIGSSIGKAYVAAGKNETGDILKGMGEAIGSFGSMLFGSGDTSGAVNLGMTGTIDSKGVATTATITKGVPAPTIQMTEFDFEHSHLGQGVWNLKKTPVIHLTDFMVDGSFVYFFDPSSVEVEVNHDLFPKKDIEWMQVDAVPFVRWDNNKAAMDNHRKFLGLRKRGFKVPGEVSCRDVLNNARVTYRQTAAEVLTNYNYGRANQGGLTYRVETPEKKVDNYKELYRGYGKQGGYIIEPLYLGDFFSGEIEATPLVINVHVTVKMKGSDKIYSYNRAYLPEVKYLIGTEENLVNLYKNEIQKRSFESYYSGHLDTYNYNVKRAYDKIKYYYPNANISYEEKK